MIETYIPEDLRAMFSMDYYLEETEDKHQTYILYSVDKELAQALVKDTATEFRVHLLCSINLRGFETYR